MPPAAVSPLREVPGQHRIGWRVVLRRGGISAVRAGRWCWAGRPEGCTTPLASPAAAAALQATTPPGGCTDRSPPGHSRGAGPAGPAWCRSCRCRACSGGHDGSPVGTTPPVGCSIRSGCAVRPTPTPAPAAPVAAPTSGAPVTPTAAAPGPGTAAAGAVPVTAAGLSVRPWRKRSIRGAGQGARRFGEFGDPDRGGVERPGPSGSFSDGLVLDHRVTTDGQIVVANSLWRGLYSGRTETARSGPVRKPG